MIQNLPYPFKDTIEYFYDYTPAKFGVDVATIATGGIVGFTVGTISGPVIGGTLGLKSGLWAGTLIALELDKGSIATLMTISIYSPPSELAYSMGYVGGFFVGPLLGPILAAYVTSTLKTSILEVAGNSIAGHMIASIPALTKDIGKTWLANHQNNITDTTIEEDNYKLTGLTSDLSEDPQTA